MTNLRLLADTTTDPLNFSQLGIAAVVCALLLTGLLWALRAYQAEAKENKQLRSEMLVRERELSKDVIPVLEQGLAILTSLPTKVEQMLRTSQEAVQRSELESVLDRIKSALGTAEKRGRPQ